MKQTTSSSSSSSSSSAAAAAAAASVASTNAQEAAKIASSSATIIAVVANDVAWMKGSLTEILKTLSEMSKAFVTAVQHQEVVKEIVDHEERLRTVEQRIQIWAGGLLILSFSVPILLKIFVK